MAVANRLDDVLADPRVREALDMAAAQRTAVLNALRDVLGLIDRKAFQPAPAQMVLNRADALLEEFGR
jgi:hypothetical protein